MKGGFINPPNDTEGKKCDNKRCSFNEGRVYKPAEPGASTSLAAGLLRFNEGRVYKPAEPHGGRSFVD